MRFNEQQSKHTARGPSRAGPKAAASIGSAWGRPWPRTYQYSLSNKLTRATAHSRPKKRSLSNKLTQPIQLQYYRLKSAGWLALLLTDQIVMHKTVGHKGSPLYFVEENRLNKSKNRLKTNFTTAKLAATINVCTTKHTTPRYFTCLPLAIPRL